MSKFKVGDRVRLTPKSWAFDKEYNTGVLTISAIQGRDTYFERSCLHQFNDTGWFELVTEGGDMKPNQRKTYRLLKDMPGYKEGTLFQEECDDGTQPYKAVGPDGDVRLQFINRGYIEDNPKWFVEVYKVEPQYMTQDELDQWEAFKKVKAPAKRGVGRPRKY